MLKYFNQQQMVLGLIGHLVGHFNGYVDANKKIRVEVIAIADNGFSKPLLLEIAWDGNWNDDAAEMGRHLVVKEVNRK